MADIVITIKPFEPLEIDLQGYHGKGCAEVADVLAALGTTVDREKKPDYNDVRVGVTATPGRIHVGR